jgi:16S rRNA C967 or C1407 C5-methylase (RsmB/RsmF family)
VAPYLTDLEFKTFADVSERRKHRYRASMFSPSEEEAKAFSLHRCIRVLPHRQNTGGFFIALLEKVGDSVVLNSVSF